MSKTQNHNIGPSSLPADYLWAINKITQLQKFATLLQMQVELDLFGDEGIAFKVNIFQNQMNAKAAYISNQFLADFIRVLSESGNFYNLWNAALTSETELIKSAVNNPDARASSSKVMLELAKQSGILNQKVKALAADLARIKDEVSLLNGGFDTVLQTAITSLGASATSYSTTIDSLQKSIKKNIDDIVEGANKTGKAVSDLLIGMLTTIKDSPVDDIKEAKDKSKDKPKDEAKDKSKDKSKEESKDESKDKTKDKSKTESKSLSTDFVINSIKGATEGGEETSQACADLNSNNSKLASEFQELAKANAVLAVAKVIKVQNDMFTECVGDSLNTIQKISETWGNTPVLPPASGISLEFSKFADYINSISTQSDADKLVDVMEYASGDWDAFNERLNYIREKLATIL